MSEEPTITDADLSDRAMSLMWLMEDEGTLECEDPSLSTYCDDRLETDAINECFDAGLLEQRQQGEDLFYCRITSEGRAFIARHRVASIAAKDAEIADLQAQLAEAEKREATQQARADSQAEWAQREAANAVSLEKQLAEAKGEVERLREALTPSGHTKADYSGDFSMGVRLSDGRGNEQSRSVMIPWTTIKEIMAAIRRRAQIDTLTGEPT